MYFEIQTVHLEHVLLQILLGPILAVFLKMGHLQCTNNTSNLFEEEIFHH